MKVLFVVPEIRLDGYPTSFPFWAGILASIVMKKRGEVAILDLNALRMNFGGHQVPKQVIIQEINSEKWDIVGIGGLTTTYGRIKELASLIRKHSPDSLFVGGGGWSTYNPDEILNLVPELDLLVIGEGEETFSELYDEVNAATNDFEKVNGLCIRDGKNIKFTILELIFPSNKYLFIILTNCSSLRISPSREPPSRALPSGIILTLLI